MSGGLEEVDGHLNGPSSQFLCRMNNHPPRGVQMCGFVGWLSHLPLFHQVDLKAGGSTPL